jgi:hypothetical protein
MELRAPEGQETLRVIITDLTEAFSDVDHDDIAAVARHEFEELSARSKAPSFVGIISERKARERIRTARLEALGRLNITQAS